MRYIVAAVIATLILSYAATADAQGRYFVYGLGTHSCGKYLAAVHGHPPGVGKVINHPEGRYSDDHVRYLAWLEGFFTATNLWVTHEPNGIESDTSAIDVWIRKWCEQNPTKSLSEAASAFALDQRQEYLRSYFARQPK
jgi:hypothetical protein